MRKTKGKVSRITWTEIRKHFHAWCYKKKLGAHNVNVVTHLNMGYAFEAGYRAAIKAERQSARKVGGGKS